MNNDSRMKNSIRNILTGVVGYFFSVVFSFIGRTIFIRTLSAEYLGINGLFSNVLNMLSLAELGISSAIVYALYLPLTKKDEKTISALMNFYRTAYKIIGCVVAVIGCALIPFLPVIVGETPNIKENIYLIYVLYLFNTSSSYFFSYKFSLLSADQKHYLVSGWSYIISYITTIVQIVILVTTHNYLVYLIIQFSSVLIYNIILSMITDKQYPFLKKYHSERIDTKTKIELVKNVKALVIIKISGMLVTSTDNIIINIFNGLSITGITSNYTLLSNTINSVLTQIFNGITASVGNFNAIKNDDEKYKLFNQINFLNFWFYGWSGICLVILSNPFIRIIWGDEYVAPLSIPLAIGINLYVLGMQNATWTFKSTLGLFNYGKYVLLGTAGINLVLSCVLGKIWGVFGILIATSIARCCTNVWYEPYAVFKYGMHKNPMLYFRKYLIYAILEIFLFVVTYEACSLTSFTPLLDFAVKLIICCLLPNFLICIFFFRTEEFKYFIVIALRLCKKIVLKR